MSEQQPEFDIVRTAHIEFLVNDLSRAREFYVETLGLVETASDRTHLYLRGYEDRFHHCLLLTKAKRPGIGHISYRVRKQEDLGKIARLFAERKLQTKWLKPNEEEGQGSALRAQDPLGFPVEFFKEMEEADWLMQQFDKHKRARIMRIDHVNLLVPDVNEASTWYTDALGFACSEFTEIEGKKRKNAKKIWATWLRRKPTVHDVALMTGRGPRLHHAGFVVAEKANLLDCADIMAARGYLSSMERGPGRHGISNAFFLYIRDPDGHRVELYTGDYLSVDPDWKPLRWKLNDPQRQTFWGSPAPERWFDEASEVRSVFTGEPIPASEPTFDARR